MPVATNTRENIVSSVESGLDLFPPLTKQHIVNCSFSSWYNKFRSVTIKSKIIKPLSKEFIDYLHADSVFLPEEEDYLERSELSDEEEDDNEEEADNIENQAIPSFPDLEQQIIGIIEEFGGAIFPKLNWSSPRDATWISSTNTLKCNSASDIFLLLKSSDFIAYDLDHAFDGCNHDNNEEGEESEDSDNDEILRRQRSNEFEFELVIRKWCNMEPSMEFRCFVKNEELVAISQRDITYYPFLNEIKEELKIKIIDFFNTCIKNKFYNPYYVFDVYVTRNRERVWLIDFNPFGSMTDSILYSWEEILSETLSSLTLFRIVTSQIEASQFHNQNFSVNRYPREVIDFSQGQTVIEFAERFQRELLCLWMGKMQKFC
ncbi:10552_t:CDS:2 [Entrophospora sp. SA101]|nr:11047_t:CDS:2 [Entrophospora sp. SA101]CAJ0636930.1 10552_t:CDS:2 [Entrophospora sp. SA101]